MLLFLARRLVGLVPVLALAIVLTFVAIQALPGDPIAVMLSNHSADVELADRLRAEYGLDQPLWRQFLSYVVHVAHGDFGLSFRFVHTPVIDVLSDGLKVSPILALAALAVAVPLGTFAGAFAAIHRNRWPDTAVILFLVLGISIPNFAFAAFLTYLFAIKLGVLPVAGWGSIDRAVLPIAVLAIPNAAYIARLSRTFMLDVLQQDYVRTARAKGMPERLVIWRHAFRNTLIPLLTQIGIIFGGLISTSFVVETIFNIPGLGRLAIQSIFARDYPVAMAIILLFTIFYALINLAVDLLYSAIDPRLRSQLAARPLTDLNLAIAVAPASADHSPFWRRFLADKRGCAGAAIVLVLVVIALFAPLLAHYPYDDTDLLSTWAPPSSEHWLGADKLGRDIYTRLLYGARTSLVVSLSVVAITLTVGIAFGMAAGYFGGWIDTLIMRPVDIILAFPDMVFAILVTAMLGPSVGTVVIALSLVWWPGAARLTRALVLVQKNELYVDAAIVSGTPVWRIFLRHFLPNLIAPLTVRASVGIGLIIMAEASLSLLGLGVQEPTPSWGSMIRDGLEALRTDPYLALFGSAVLAITIIGFNLLGDALRDLLDPKLAAR